MRQLLHPEQGRCPTSCSPRCLLTSGTQTVVQSRRFDSVVLQPWMQRGISTSKNIFLGRRCYKSDVSTRIAGSGLTEFPLGDKTFRQVIAERQHKLTTAIELEREAQREQMTLKYGTKSLGRLVQDGVVLINLDCAHEGNLFSEVVFRFTLPGGKRLPRTRFSQRDNVRVSRVISPSGSQASQAAPQRTPRNRQARPESKEGDRRGAEESGVEENSFAEWSESSPDEDQAKSLVKRENLDSFEGVVVDVGRDFITVALRDEPGEALRQRLMEDASAGRGWRIDEDLDDKMHGQLRRTIKALGEFVVKNNKNEINVRQILVGVPGIDLTALSKSPPPWTEDPFWRGNAAKALKATTGLNRSQMLAIGTALTRSVVLWQGPPGTGKTTTLTAMVDVVVKTNVMSDGLRSQGGLSMGDDRARLGVRSGRERMGPILVCAGTNAATDNIVEGLAARGLDVVRIGYPARVRPELRQYTVDAKARASREGQNAAALEADAEKDMADLMQTEARLKAQLQGGEPNEAVASSLAQVARGIAEARRRRDKARRDIRQTMVLVAKRAQVLAATVAGSGDQLLRETDLAFPLVIVDEAAQIPEAHCLIPLVQGAQSIILAGDPNQLPPTVLSQEAARAGLAQTLFDRLMGAGLEPMLLDVQYRMHPLISKVPSVLFYGGRVKSGVSAEQRPPVQGIRWPLDGFPVAMVDVDDGVETRDENMSWTNDEEAHVVLRLLEMAVRDKGFIEEFPTVAVLTPYKGQLRRLQSSLTPFLDGQTRMPSEALFVSTVDGFQGREADLVIISTVRNNDGGQLGFVSDPRRMNVALTRARRGVVVVGSARTLQEDTNWGTWLRWCQKQGAVTTLEAMTPAPSSGTSREASGGKAERRGGGGKSGEASGLQRVPGGDSGVGGAKVAAHGADAGRGRGRRSMTAAMGATGRGSAVRGELRKRVGAAPGLATGKQGAAGGASSSGRQRDLGKGASSRRRRRTGAE